MKRRVKSRISLALAFGLVGACSSDVVGPEGWRQPGVLVISGWSGNTPVHHPTDGDSLRWDGARGHDDLAAPEVLSAPDTVQAGDAFEVTTHTVGPNGCWRADGQSVMTYGRVVVLKPYDAHSGAEVCTEQLVFPAHGSTVVLHEPGEWSLRVDGRRLRLGEEVWDEPISAERTIVVR